MTAPIVPFGVPFPTPPELGAPGPSITPDLIDVFNLPNITPIYLLEIKLGRLLQTWEIYSSNVYRFYLGSRRPIPFKVEEDGTQLTRRFSTSQVTANAGSWYHSSGNYIYVHPINSDNAYDHVYLFVEFLGMATKPKIFTGTVSGETVTAYYEPRVVNVPRVNIRIEPLFSGVGQIGGANLRLANTDAWFNDYIDYQWNGSTIGLRVGADKPNNEMDYVDYGYIGEWRAESWIADDEVFDVQLEELKTDLQREIPFEVYTTDDYPSLGQTDEGKPIQIAYGQVYSQEAIKISAGSESGEFIYKVAGHRIFGIGTVREPTGTGTYVVLETSQINKAEATFAATPSDPESTLVVDFIGKATSNGLPLLSPAEIVQDILTTLGEQDNIDTASFAAAKAWLRLGSQQNPDTFIHNIQLGIYINKAIDAFELISEINRLASTYLYVNSQGKYVYGVHKPSVSEGLIQLDETDILAFETDHDASEIVSKVNATYAERTGQEWGRVFVEEREENQHANGYKSPVAISKLLQIANENGARYWVSKTLFMRRKPIEKYTLRTKWQAVQLEVGDEIRVVYDRYNVNGVFEVLATNIDFSSSTVTLTLGDRRGFDSSYGFFAEDSPTLPARLGGAVITKYRSDWTTEQEKWAQENIGFWSTDYGYLAFAGDPGSNVPSYRQTVFM